MGVAVANCDVILHHSNEWRFSTVRAATQRRRKMSQNFVKFRLRRSDRRKKPAVWGVRSFADRLFFAYSLLERLNANSSFSKSTCLMLKFDVLYIGLLARIYYFLIQFRHGSDVIAKVLRHSNVWRCRLFSNVEKWRRIW